MKTKRPKQDGFFMNLTSEDRKILDELKDKYAVNIAQAFRIFLKDMLWRLNK
jgi:hypothetical protein